MPFSFTNITAANSTLQIIDAINKDWTGGMFGILMLASLGIIIYINLSYYGTKENFLYTTFYLSIIAGLMWLAGLIGMYVFVICVVLAFIGVLTTILMGG